MFWFNSVPLSPSLSCLLPYFSAGLRAGSAGMEAAVRGMGLTAQVVVATPSPSGVWVPVQVVSTVPHLSLLLNLKHKCMLCVVWQPLRRRLTQREGPLREANVPHWSMETVTLFLTQELARRLCPQAMRPPCSPSHLSVSLFFFLPSLLSSPVMDFLVPHTYPTFQA